ncbi:anti-sigma factor family protein [Tautonia marina]|uniref:anti-sigma factor family protein n=1 Tax=Tautonia marina TaxID=2653855 RepID=UPI00126057D3|nr:hypothetical protein [Tautonia marina]
MPTIDDSLIHAYVDDELDPESRLLVEQAAEADPRVAHSLSELARLHGLMANVHRPPDLPDVSGAVVARLNQAATRRRALQPIASSTILALAALLMVTLFWNRPVPQGGQGQGPLAGVEDPADALPEETIAPAGTEAEPEVEVAANDSTPETIVAEAAPEDPDVTVAEAPVELAADQAAFLLDLVDFDRSRTFVIEPMVGVSAEELAEELNHLLRDTLRSDPRYGHLATAEPEADGRPADLFLLVANPTEEKNLLDQLEESLGDRCRVVEPVEADPAQSLLLGDAGSLVLKSVEQAAPLRSREERLLANRGHDHEPEAKGNDRLVIPPPQPQGVLEFPLPPRPSPEAVEDSANTDDRPNVMVFWVRPSR